MERDKDPYKLGWRFWSRYLSRTLIITTLGAALYAYFFDEPFSVGRITAWFILYSLVWLGPELSIHYRKTPEQLSPHQKR